jgi:hypothetical protein
MPAAQFLGRQQDPLGGESTQLSDQLRGIALNKGKISWIVFLPRRSRHASSARADL